MGYGENAPPYKEDKGHLVAMTEADAKANAEDAALRDQLPRSPVRPDVCNKMADGMYYNVGYSPAIKSAMPRAVARWCR